MKEKLKFDYYDSSISSILFVVLQYLFLRLYVLLPADVRSGAIAIIASCLLEGIFLLTVYLTSKITNTKFLPATTFNKKINIGGVLLSIAIAVVFLIFASPLTNVFAAFLEKVGYTSSLGGIKVNNFLTYFIYVIIMCAIPAITEESLFRSCMLGGLKEKNKHMAVAVSAVFFMLMHGGPDQTVHQLLMGILAGYIFVYTENIWYPIIIHFVNNFIAVTISYMYSGVETATNAAESATAVTWSELGVSLVTAVIMAAAGTAIIFFLVKELIKQINEKKNTVVLENTQSDADETKELTEIEQVIIPQKDNRKKWIPITLFTLSGLYLIFEWLLTLLVGLGVV